MQNISVSELADWMADATRTAPLLLDVREPWEYQTCHIEAALLMPMQSIPSSVEQLDVNANIVCICHHGARSLQVAVFLERNGFTNVSNLSGGMHAWAQQIDPAMPTY
jgi:rhodanese-related sulfurtransferase